MYEGHETKVTIISYHVFNGLASSSFILILTLLIFFPPSPPLLSHLLFTCRSNSDWLYPPQQVYCCTTASFLSQSAHDIQARITSIFPSNPHQLPRPLLPYSTHKYAHANTHPTKAGDGIPILLLELGGHVWCLGTDRCPPGSA